MDVFKFHLEFLDSSLCLLVSERAKVLLPAQRAAGRVLEPLFQAGRTVVVPATVSQLRLA